MFIEHKDHLDEVSDSEMLLRTDSITAIGKVQNPNFHVQFHLNSIIISIKGKLRPRQMSNRRMAAKQKKVEFRKLFAENKHRFDMSCDYVSCSSVFESLEEARRHYATEHNSSKGHIKCCNVKLTYRCEVVRHLYRHLDPNKFKCVPFPIQKKVQFDSSY